MSANSCQALLDRLKVRNWYLDACTAIVSLVNFAKGLDEGEFREKANTKGRIVSIATIGAGFDCVLISLIYIPDADDGIVHVIQ
jgi:hypothetical protein